MRQDPETDEEWQEVAQLARGAQLFHAARTYGLVRGGPVIDVARCEELVARALARGIVVDDDDAAKRILAALAGGRWTL